MSQRKSRATASSSPAKEKVSNVNEASASRSRSSSPATNNNNNSTEKSKGDSKEKEESTTSNSKSTAQSSPKAENAATTTTTTTTTTATAKKQNEHNNNNNNNNKKDDRYDIEKIVRKFRVDGKPFYEVQWKEDHSHTFEPEENLDDCEMMLKHFKAAHDTDEEVDLTENEESDSEGTEDEGNDKEKKDESSSKHKGTKSETKKKKSKTSFSSKKRRGQKTLAAPAARKSAPVATDEVSEYEVEAICGVQGSVPGKRKFLIKWKGFSEQDNTWEPELNLTGSKVIVNKFLDSIAKDSSPNPKTKGPSKKRKVSKPQDESGNDYEVQSILAKRTVHGAVEYLVSWRGYDVAQSTWEPVSSLQGCKLLLATFEQRVSSKHDITRKRTTK